MVYNGGLCCYDSRVPTARASAPADPGEDEVLPAAEPRTPVPKFPLRKLPNQDSARKCLWPEQDNLEPAGCHHRQISKAYHWPPGYHAVARRLVQARPRGYVFRAGARRYPRFPPVVGWNGCRPPKIPIVQLEGSAHAARQALGTGSHVVDCGYRG